MISLKERHLEFMSKLTDKWIKKIKEDQDVVCVVYGREGSGKSSLALILAHCLAEKQGKKFDIKKNVHYKVEDFHNAIFNSDKGDIQIIDESILFSFSRRAMSKENTTLVKLLATCRSRNNIIFFCIPNLKTIDSYLKEHRIVCGLEVYAKGRFKIWSMKAIQLFAQSKPHNQRQTIIDYFPSVEQSLGLKEWEEYLKHKDNKLKHETIEVKENDITYLAAKEIKKKYGLGYAWLGDRFKDGTLEAVTLPSGHRRYSIKGVRELLGVK